MAAIATWRAGSSSAFRAPATTIATTSPSTVSPTRCRQSHSPDEYILVKPALYSTSHQGRQLVFARSDSQRRENLLTLPEKLAAFRTSFEAGGPPYNAPDCVNELMHRATDELIASGAAERALKAGDRGRNSPSRTPMVTRCRHETGLRGGRSW